MKIQDGFTYLTKVKGLIQAYTDSLGRDLSFQNLNTELADLQKKYGFPTGRLLAAVADDGDIVGCVAYCRHTSSRCEMKRLYVVPAYRKEGVGQALLTEIVNLAAADGYEEMVLDTLLPMESAIRLYRRNDFVEIPAYYENPMDDVLYFRRTLNPPQKGEEK
ncbi:GNAT family N-acetyltransferase [Anaerotignum sp.]|uniref:GNAT family N-acetyltransferase n=1 Tax=Anaerotignum sp. TaxID=2039241 RepID=UPI002A9204F5|nr:GNAT family N-acetyltransferase [Anaerotignum sp.]MCI7657621.1 GNAT family N-acetyltransferase [Clostridia bacterium]MDY5415400.1 GNAT family N-acetyltransferase [Anaerotignum sp.]